MRLTKVLFGYRHPKMYFFDKKWDRLHDRRKVNPSWFKVWRRKWYVERKREVTQLPVELPSEDTEVVDAAKWLNDEKLLNYEAELVWPYEKKFVEGEPDDPYYKKEVAYVFDRSTKQWEGFKGALNFTNTILEGEELPQDIAAIEETVSLDQSILDFLDRKLRFAIHTDGMMSKLPPIKEFPFISKTPPKIAGVPVTRKETNILNAFYEAANLHICKNNRMIDRRRLNNPECIFPFERESRRCILDLWCDFLTLSRRGRNSFCLPSDNPVQIFKDPSTTEDENLVDIHPVNWEICFDPTHLWPEKYVMSTPIDDQIHTIYLSDCAIRHKPLPDRMAKGRNVMFCYGYSAAQFRRWYGNWDDWKDPLNYVDLTNPILINCVDVNSSKMKMSFASFQLNTTRFDSNVKNQVWLDGAFSINDDKELILKKVIALNLFGAHNKINPDLYKKIEEQPKEASINVQ